ncbi:serine/threonine-protein kinase [Nocardia seriolae]|uniref:non-specific serine/threonine protein kinase n=2 Tax=Nocardia seriolae TaxID=37332 RepID=A0ABC8B5K0_9NOCA|nr:serine/threonine-protein kinase [Nocardia seriolae]APB01679.1 Non-specific serine/threonine protein kinase [Nocardia seriolae]MTJ60849.1 protein kinase [Nocardia seriolae]MTJ71423.1 protein kinase [Nocardia seriolae]MTJ91011.1 protein kinase [Nocardia seriolae]MTK34969.1 protein kinase [Nocardia seriolae]
MPGDGRLGHYRLVRLLGRGGMGQVWLAQDTHLEREVALKLLPVELATDEDYRRRFEREARLAARLRGPHVVPIHSFGELDGRLYIDMEYVEGSDLDKILREVGALPPDRAVDLVTQIAAALDIAHRAGLVHRDVKPSNVITLPDGFAYLIDFGIARGVGQATITSTGVAVGTWAYMAPERYAGTEDLRSDIYSLACLLYETLTGAKPFAQTDPVQPMAAHVTADPPRASDRNPRIPAALDAVIVRGMAKDPDHRFPTAGALATAAQSALETPPTSRPGPAPGRRSAPTAKWDGGEPLPGYAPAYPGAVPTPPPAWLPPQRANRPAPTASPPLGGPLSSATPQPFTRPPGEVPSAATPRPGARPPSSNRPPFSSEGAGVVHPFGGAGMGASAGVSGMGSGGTGYVSPYSGLPVGAGYSGGVTPGPERPRVRPWQPVWWVVLGLLTLLFAIMTVGTVGVTFSNGFGDAGSTVIAWFIFVGPFALFVWLVVREVKKFKAERRRWREAGGR